MRGRREQLRSMTFRRCYRAIKLLWSARAKAEAGGAGRLHEVDEVIDMLDESMRLAIRKASQ